MRIVILGANGPTGRLLTGQILAAGHDAVALTRRSADFPLADPRLAVVGGDVLDPAAVDSVVDGSDACCPRSEPRSPGNRSRCTRVAPRTCSTAWSRCSIPTWSSG